MIVISFKFLNIYVVCVMIFRVRKTLSGQEHWQSLHRLHKCSKINWAPSSEFVSSSIPSWPILTAHAQPFRGARDLAFCQKVPLDSLLVWASSGGSGETARMRRLAWTFAARIGDKYQIRLTRPNLSFLHAQGFDLCSFLNEMCVSIKETLPQIRKRPYKRDASRFTLKGNHERQERARKVQNVKICLLILSSSMKRLSALLNMVLMQLLCLDA